MADIFRFIVWAAVGAMLWTVVEATYRMVLLPLLYRTGVVKRQRAYHVTYMCRKCDDCGSDQVYAYGDEQHMAYCDECGCVQ